MRGKWVVQHNCDKKGEAFGDRVGEEEKGWTWNKKAVGSIQAG